MQFESKSGTLKIQITDDDMLQSLAFGLVTWSLPVSSISSVAAKDIAFNTCKKLTLYTKGGQSKEIASISNNDYETLLTFLPEGSAPMAVQRGKKQWYHDMGKQTHVAVYTNQKEAAKEMEEAAKFGWVPQTSAAQNGKFSVGKAVAGGLVTAVVAAPLAPFGLLAGAVGNKGKLTITYMRSR